MYNRGDKVRATSSGHPQITEGNIYEVAEYRKGEFGCGPYVYLVEGDRGHHASDDGISRLSFELVQTADGLISVGETVRMSKAGRIAYGNTTRNPADLTGIVVENTRSGRFIYGVRWSNGEKNDYTKEQIELAQEVVGTSLMEEVVKATIEENEGEDTVENVIYTYSGDSATVVIDGKVSTVTSGEGSFAALIEELKQPVHDVEKIKCLVDKKTAVETYTQGRVNISGGIVTYDGVEINDALTDKMLQMMDEGFDIGPWVAFLENLMQNPSFNSRKCLFNFLEKFQAPFTPDGCFIAFKRVDQDFKDLRTHTMDNSPGTVVKMNRADVDDNPRNTCSSGLHCAASSYLDSYANATRAKTIMLKVNPKDVVAVPADYNFAKMRVCEYEVLADITVEEMKDYETRAVVDSWEDSEEVSSDWSEGDWITYEGPDYGYMQNGKDYCIVEVDECDNTVCVLDNDGDRFWLDYDGTDA